MAMDSGHGHQPGGRTAQLAAVIASELARQAQAGISPVDVEALAAAIVAIIGNDHLPFDEGRHPDQLNATNDD